MSWSEWHRLLETTPNPAKQCKMGVYRIRITNEEGQPVSIPRACAPDREGILYIGRGKLPVRVGVYRRAFSSDPNPELSSPVKYQFHWVYVRYGLERLGDPKGLEIQWQECDECRGEEQRLLEEYKHRTGDIPPGNLKKEGRPIPVLEEDVEEA